LGLFRSGRREVINTQFVGKVNFLRENSEKEESDPKEWEAKIQR